MELKDQITDEEYNALPGPNKVYYSFNKESGVADLDLSLNRVIERSGHLTKMTDLKNQVTTLNEVVGAYRNFAETPEELGDRIKKWQDMETLQLAQGDDLNQKIAALKEASDKKLGDELTKQAQSFKEKISKLEKQNEEYNNTIKSITLWDKVVKIAPDLKSKFHDTFKNSFLNEFCLNEDGNLTLSGTDPESLLNKPESRMDEIRKKYSELFEQPAQQQEFSSYGNRRQDKNELLKIQEEYKKALSEGNVTNMRAAQNKMRAM